MTRTDYTLLNFEWMCSTTSQTRSSVQNSFPKILLLWAHHLILIIFWQKHAENANMPSHFAQVWAAPFSESEERNIWRCAWILRAKIRAPPSTHSSECVWDLSAGHPLIQQINIWRPEEIRGGVGGAQKKTRGEGVNFAPMARGPGHE